VRVRVTGNEHKISFESLRGRDHAEELRVYGCIILNTMDLRKMCKEDVDWINPLQDRQRLLRTW
jgi:hypothetical protein